ncbi:NAD(P)-binding domain-containing protein [Sphingosinicella sp. CPCC 101087]|uniref:NAD(P)-binding domain-containing protein n=1 Tax=Sphingosinicella sp. CPCC 101087 TaxID=2497754 RepID=UPI00101C4763|nr:NAD(P)-binding domain-containing protein [Sphingosinicella sp. CPCC 101087]
MASAFKIAVVGSGPAGLSAAARAAQLGLSHVLLEKTDHLSDTIYKYQKGKHVMATPSQLVLRSDMGFDAGKREVILGTWDRQAEEHKINVKLNAEVKQITGQKGDFTLLLTSGEEVKAEYVILGIGTQGNPNKMRCEGGDLPHIQYQLDDPGEYVDEHIAVIGSGDAGIENALGLAADPEQGNTVYILNRSAEFARAKTANVDLLMEAKASGRINVMCETSPVKVLPGWLHVETRDGEQKIKCDRIIARMGSAPPRKFVEQCGIKFTSDDRDAYPQLSPEFETTVPGIYVIGALAGYPLIKHCMNQGYDVIEFINGNRELKPADEPILEEKFSVLPGQRSVTEWLAFLRRRVTILNDLSMLQMREFMLDSEPRAYRAGDVLFERNDPGASLFAIADGSVLVEVDPNDPSRTVPIQQGSIVGEVGLISGRKRGATVRTAEGAIVIEIPRSAALKLMATNAAAKREITRISTERQLLQMFGSVSSDDLAEVLASAEIMEIRAGQAIINEGEDGYDIFVIRQGSMVVEKNIGGKPVFLSYLPAGSYVGEMALIDGGRRTATVRAAIKSEVIKLDGEAFRNLLRREPELLSKFRKDMSSRQELTSFVEARKDSFGGVVDMYSSVAGFLVENGIGEATDVLLIDEKLCIGCDNCERACADAHEGLSRLDREAGRTYAHLHVPTSCRHCEHPHCMADCPPNALNRGPDGEVYINDTCIGCGNCQRNCPYGVIRMAKVPPKKPGLLRWLFFGSGPGPGEADKKWTEKRVGAETPKKAIKCDMCLGIDGGPACVRACPTGAAIRVSPEEFLTVARMGQTG